MPRPGSSPGPRARPRCGSFRNRCRDARPSLGRDGGCYALPTVRSLLSRLLGTLLLFLVPGLARGAEPRLSVSPEGPLTPGAMCLVTFSAPHTVPADVD